MSLYDDFDVVKTRTTENVSGWSSGIKLLQSQMQLKKAITTQPKREQIRKASLAPVIDLKSKKDEDDIYPNLPNSVHVHHIHHNQSKVEINIPIIPSAANFSSEFDWNVIDEYDPLWPNEYEKVVKEMRELREKENEKMQEEREKKRDRRRKSRFADNEEPSSPAANPVQASFPSVGSGFAGRWESEEDEPPISKGARGSGGVAIAPPPSLQESSPERPSMQGFGGGGGGGAGGKAASGNYSGGGSVAAKIMARYGFKEGQGLGKQEQGMSIALQVEKTSKRGGRIIHEKELKEMMAGPNSGQFSIDGDPMSPTGNDREMSITEIMKTPSKVVLLRNMVGPGEVDDDLEPEVKDECNTKYGEVGSVIIHEMPEREAEESVRIFVEFKRIESAIKAVVDLNGRFFGGRMVRAGFYDCEKFDNLQLFL